MQLVRLTEADGEVIWMNPQFIRSVRRDADDGKARIECVFAESKITEIAFMESFEDAVELVNKAMG